MNTATDKDLQDSKGVVYLIKNNVTGECYVGKTERTFWKRYNSGKWWIKSENQTLKESAAKHGVENFSVFLLEKDLTGDSLSKKELEHINEYNCIHPEGYNKVRNSSSGLTGASEDTRRKISVFQRELRQRVPSPLIGVKRSAETCELIRRRKLGTKASEETKKKMSETRSGEKHPNFGKTTSQTFFHSEETKKKIGNKNKLRGYTATLNIVLLLDDNGQIIKEFASPEQSSIELGISVENVYSCCRHKKGQTKACGFILVYKNKPKCAKRAVVQIDKDSLEIIREFESITDAARAVGSKGVQNIRFVCEGKRLTCRGFRWRFKNEIN